MRKTCKEHTKYTWILCLNLDLTQRNLILHMYRYSKIWGQKPKMQKQFWPQEFQIRDQATAVMANLQHVCSSRLFMSLKALKGSPPLLHGYWQATGSREKDGTVNPTEQSGLQGFWALPTLFLFTATSAAPSDQHLLATCVLHSSNPSWEPKVSPEMSLLLHTKSLWKSNWQRAYPGTYIAKDLHFNTLSKYSLRIKQLHPGCTPDSWGLCNFSSGARMWRTKT